MINCGNYLNDDLNHARSPTTLELQYRTQTKPDQTKTNRTKPNRTKPNQTKPNQTKSNQAKPNLTNPNQTQQTKPKLKRWVDQCTVLCAPYSLLIVLIVTFVQLYHVRPIPYRQIYPLTIYCYHTDTIGVIDPTRAHLAVTAPSVSSHESVQINRAYSRLPIAKRRKHANDSNRGNDSSRGEGSNRRRGVNRGNNTNVGMVSNR